jgi:hypothetical protein
MAAARAQLNRYLEDILGIGDQAARDAINAQGLDTFEDFLLLEEKDIEDVCSNVRKPGGVIPNPNYDPANVVAGVPATIPNPGIQLGHIYEKRLKLLRYYLHHLERIQQTMNPATANVGRLTSCYRLKDTEDNAEDLELPSKLSRIEKVRDVLEDMDNYLVRKLGSSGLPLAYVVREEVAVPIGALDPGYGLPTISEEMIARGPHSGTHFQKDNNEVWQMICHVTHGGPGWSWVQAHQRACDGRQAYLAIKMHYVGESYSARIRAHADNVIESSYYDGKSRSFTFERYCEVLKSAFTDIETTGEEISETRKVRKLLQGITDGRLASAKSQVLATPALKATFESALNFIAQFLDEKRSFDGSAKANQRNLSAFNRSNTKGQNVKAKQPVAKANMSNPKYKNKNFGVTDRYYKYKEWINLTADQQAKVRELKANREKRARNVNTVETTAPKPSPKTVTFEQVELKQSEVGAIMSQRKQTNRSL